MADTYRRRHALDVINWLVERHHQSLGLWPWTWEGQDGERYVTLYARCAALRFDNDFAALADWVETCRWPPLDGTPHPATFFRDQLGMPDWAERAPVPATGAPDPRPIRPDLDALARAGTPIDTVAQLLESTTALDDYLATLAPLRHGGHAHREEPGRMAVLVMRLATEVALALGEDYAIPWTGPAGGRANGIADPDWDAFGRRYRLEALPFPPSAQDIFTFGERGWLHAGGWAGDRHGNVVRLNSSPGQSVAVARGLVLRLLGAE